ncbi:MAG: hypothetical protein OEW87_04425, partial [Flavobacteriaceae bacterium]|nr:hypothetical protein [Flavobacteriaceae bacterium]
WDDFVRRPVQDFARKNAGHYFFKSYQNEYNEDWNGLDKTEKKWKFWANFRDVLHADRDDIEEKRDTMRHILQHRMDNAKTLQYLTEKQQLEFIKNELDSVGVSKETVSESARISVDDFMAYFKEQQADGNIAKYSEQDKEAAHEYIERYEQQKEQKAAYNSERAEWDRRYEAESKGGQTFEEWIVSLRENPDPDSSFEIQ